MLSEEEIGKALVKICIEDENFDVIIIHERDYMKWVATGRVLNNVLYQNTREESLPEYAIPDIQEEDKRSHSQRLQVGAFGIGMPQAREIDHSVLLDAYRRYVSVHFHPSQMNVFLLVSVKYGTNHDLTTRVDVSFLFRHVADFQLDPVNMVRRLYQSDRDTPIQECINKR
jgi:hypothetical protein